MTVSVRDDVAQWIKLRDEPRVRENRRYLDQAITAATVTEALR